MRSIRGSWKNWARGLALAVVGLTVGCAESLPIGVPERLPEIVLAQLPERTHWRKGTKFRWVCFDRARCRGFTESELDGIEAVLRRRYEQVYLAQEEIPHESQVFDGQDGSVLMGYRGGYVIQFEIERLPNGRVKLSHDDYENYHAASWGYNFYEWQGNVWMLVGRGEFVVS